MFYSNFILGESQGSSNDEYEEGDKGHEDSGCEDNNEDNKDAKDNDNNSCFGISYDSHRYEVEPIGGKTSKQLYAEEMSYYINAFLFVSQYFLGTTYFRRMTDTVNVQCRNT